jgi:hypothetical protein
MPVISVLSCAGMALVSPPAKIGMGMKWKRRSKSAPCGPASNWMVWVALAVHQHDLVARENNEPGHPVAVLLSHERLVDGRIGAHEQVASQGVLVQAAATSITTARADRRMQVTILTPTAGPFLQSESLEKWRGSCPRLPR